ncbi:MAG: DUF1629 domain-containing protein [Pseudomonadota bacterium]
MPGDHSSTADVWHCNCLSVFHTAPHQAFTFDKHATPNYTSAVTKAFQRGEFVDDDLIPKALTIKDSQYDATDFEDFFRYTFCCVSEPFRDFLLGFDIGGTRFVPIDIYQSDGVTKRAETYFILNIVSQKECLVPEETHTSFAIKIKDGLWRATHRREDFQLTVRSSSREGADLWIDPRLRGDLFFSDRLHAALKATDLRPYNTPDRVASLAAGGLKPHFEVARCKIIEQEAGR